ncbi:FeS-binding protein [Candidatus Desulfarcum epimagneticum]|uniref:FeS-binding protein n=1 Tax=uncultured Desulfobacteraceae bacterium TaxID=218296 RepID=A0A484HI12_9BACT|nr:FeS-binding protein [uncultured Desulfobacteraceae bacterium]
MEKNFFAKRARVSLAYGLILFMTALSGFAQMPIFKRYYIADIPGLGWLADFFVTHYIHYAGAAALLFLFAYFSTAYLLAGPRRPALSRSSFARIALLAALVLTGAFRVLKNLPDVVFSPGFTLFIDISHMAFAMFFLLAIAAFRLMKTGWLKSGR